MNLTFLSFVRLLMFLLISYVYYISFPPVSILQEVFMVFAVLIFTMNHFLLTTSKYERYFFLFLGMDCLVITGFVFLYPEINLYLILFGIEAVTLFLGTENRKVIGGFFLAFLFVWGAGIYYSYVVTGEVEVISHIINFTFIFFSAIVGRLIYKLTDAQEKIETQYNQLHESHHALQEAHQQLHHYSNQVEELTIIQERSRISREIHDTVGHKMTALLIQLQAAKELQEIQPEKSKATILLCEDLARSALQEIRLSVRTLQEEGSGQYSFMTTIKSMLEDFQKMTDLKSDFQLHGELSHIPPSIQLHATRIIQESVTNAVKHGQATRCEIVMEVSDSFLEVTVKDNGKGTSQVAAGFGLTNMRERVQEYGGTIMFESNQTDGFIVKARFPLNHIHWKLGEAQ